MRGSDVLVDDGRDVARGEGVEIEDIFDWDFVRIHTLTVSGCHFRFYSPFTYPAVTVVVIPPRAEKSPTTVMRRGAQTATRSSRIWLVTAS